MIDFNPKLNRSLIRDISHSLLAVGGVVIVAVCYHFYPSMMLPALILGAILLAGFFLPRLIGSKVAAQRAHKHKVKEFKKWGLVSRDREGPWLNYITYPVVRAYAPCEGMSFCSEWLIIKDGLIIVNPGLSQVDQGKQEVVYDLTTRRTYAWDGCSPKRLFYWLAILGTPDWHKKEMDVKTLLPDGSGQWKVENKNVYWQLTDYASLVHDALYQYLDSIPLEKSQVDQLFHEMLKEAGMLCCVRGVYHLAVKYFGGKISSRKPMNSDFSIKGVDIVGRKVGRKQNPDDEGRINDTRINPHPGNRDNIPAI